MLSPPCSINVLPYLDLPYANKGRGPDEFDCWGLCRWVLKKAWKIDLPSYEDCYLHCQCPKTVTAAIAAEIHKWQRVDKPRPGDLVLFDLFGVAKHIGVVVEPNRFLHIRRKTRSVVESLEHLIWKQRIEGFYRHAG